MRLQKTRRMLAYLGFQDFDKLDIQIKPLRYDSAEIKVIDKHNKVVLSIDMYCFPKQITQWYIDIPVAFDSTHTIKPLGIINNPTIDTYLTIQSKYLKLFDKLHHNAQYAFTKIQVTMDILDMFDDETIPDNEFSLTHLEFTSQVTHHKIPMSSIGILIEKSTKMKLRESQLFNLDKSTDITEQTLNEALLLCEMMTI